MVGRRDKSLNQPPNDLTDWNQMLRTLEDWNCALIGVQDLLLKERSARPYGD